MFCLKWIVDKKRLKLEGILYQGRNGPSIPFDTILLSVESLRAGLLLPVSFLAMSQITTDAKISTSRGPFAIEMILCRRFDKDFTKRAVPECYDQRE